MDGPRPPASGMVWSGGAPRPARQYARRMRRAAAYFDPLASGVIPPALLVSDILAPSSQRVPWSMSVCGSAQNSCPPRFLNCRPAFSRPRPCMPTRLSPASGGRARDPCDARRGVEDVDGASGGATRGNARRSGDVSGRHGGGETLPSPVGRRGQELCQRPRARAREQRRGQAIDARTAHPPRRRRPHQPHGARQAAVAEGANLAPAPWGD